MLSIKGGHVEVAPSERRSSYAGSSLAGELANATTKAAKSGGGGGSRQQVYEKLSAASCLASCKRFDGNVRLLSIISLIVIAMLARQCTARAFPGMDSGNSNQFQGISLESGYNNAADRQQQAQAMSMASGATFAPADVEYAIELGCRNLVESILNPQRISIQPKDQRAALEFIEFMDNDRNKRLSPKHTPRFGR